jgi:PBP1b-binding outer membrane lipoprotein LpoB
MSLIHIILILSLSFFVISCGGRKTVDPLPPGSQVRQIEALPPVVYSDIITVGQFRSVCDRLARSLVAQPFVQRAPRPPIVTIRKLQNKTGIPIDKSIFQETIRARLMENSGGSVLFRDDVSYKDILEERLRQSDNEVTVTVTDSNIQSRTRDKLNETQFDSGFLSGVGGTDEVAYNTEEEREVEISQSGSIKSKVAEADYFLRGIIYQIKERNANKPGEGMNYFQFQFRVVDARNGIIVWEKMLDSKMEGEYQPLNAGAGAVAPPGVAPPGQGGAWPPTTTTPGQPGQPGQPGGQQPWPPNQPGAQQQQGTQPGGNAPAQPGAGISLPGVSSSGAGVSGTGLLKSIIKQVGKSLKK